jgi:hypothetical protein
MPVSLAEQCAFARQEGAATILGAAPPLAFELR